jgi:hypothetical protein
MDTPRKYDEALKSIFSHPNMIRTLVKTFVNEDWVNSLDFSSLTPGKNDYIARKLKKQQQDLIWKIRSNDTWVYLLFLLEFQSSNDFYMANRILTYGALAYQELIKNKELELPKHRLPPIFPLVFYTGSDPWNAPTEFRDCLCGSIPSELMEYQFNARYAVVDIGRLPLEKYNFSEDNLVLSLISLERSNSQTEIDKAIEHTKKGLAGKEQTLKQAFEEYTFDALKIKKKFPNRQFQKLSEVSMLYENADKIWDDFAQENQQKGIQKGRAGLAYEIVLKAYIQKYPNEPIQRLKAKLDCMTSDELLKSLDRFVENAFATEEITD